MSWPSTTHAKTPGGLAESWERYASDVESSTDDMLFLAEGKAFHAAAQQLRALPDFPSTTRQHGGHLEQSLAGTLRRIADLLGLPAYANLATDVERAIRTALTGEQTDGSSVLWQYRLREHHAAPWGPWKPVPVNQIAEWRTQVADMPDTAEIRPLSVALTPPAHTPSNNPRYTQRGRAFESGGRP